jgi:uncharacterized membrane protein YccC
MRMATRLSAADLRRLARRISPTVAPGGDQLRQEQARRLWNAREQRDAAREQRDEALEARDAVQQQHGEALQDVARLQAELKLLRQILAIAGPQQPQPPAPPTPVQPSTPPSPPEHPLRQEARKLFAAGMFGRAVADELGLPLDEVSAWADEWRAEQRLARQR